LIHFSSSSYQKRNSKRWLPEVDIQQTQKKSRNATQQNSNWEATSTSQLL